MGKVISLRDRLEVWKHSYTKDDLTISVSTHGRFMLSIGTSTIYLDMVDSVDFLGRVSKSLEEEMGVLYEDG